MLQRRYREMRCYRMKVYGIDRPARLPQFQRDILSPG
jgi:hypothetical protein